MVKKYLEDLSKIINRVTGTAFKKFKITNKHFFSGAASYADGKIFSIFGPKGLAIKLPKKSHDRLLKEIGTKSLQVFPKGPIKKEYVILSKTMIKNTKTLQNLIKISINYVNSNT